MPTQNISSSIAILFRRRQPLIFLVTRFVSSNNQVAGTFNNKPFSFTTVHVCGGVQRFYLLVSTSISHMQPRMPAYIDTISNHSSHLPGRSTVTTTHLPSQSEITGAHLPSKKNFSFTYKSFKIVPSFLFQIVLQMQSSHIVSIRT